MGLEMLLESALIQERMKLGMRISRFDPALFIFQRGDSLEGIVCIHVDFLLKGTKQFEEYVISKLRKDFLLGTTDSGNFKCVGLNIKQDADGISLDQESYIESLS